MAAQTWNGTTSDAWNTAANWTSAVPVSGDTVLIIGANNCTMPQDAPVPATGALIVFTVLSYSGTLDLNGSDMDVDGAVTLNIGGGSITDSQSASSIECAGEFVYDAVLPASLTITLNGTDNSLPIGIENNPASLVIDAGADVTVGSAGNQYWGAYRWIAGTFDTITNSVNASVSAGGSGNIDWDSAASRFFVLNINSGATATLTGDLYAHAITGSGSLDLVTQTVNISLSMIGTNLTVTGVALGGGHAEVHGGILIDVELPLDDAALDCTDDVVDGGGNVNVWLPGTPGIHAPVGNGLIGAGKKAA